jgi:hypothetical protein
LDAKGIAYPVMSTVFRVSSAFDMANKVFGGVNDWAQSAYKSAATCISLAGQHWLRRQKTCSERALTRVAAVARRTLSHARAMIN